MPILALCPLYLLDNVHEMSLLETILSHSLNLLKGRVGLGIAQVITGPLPVFT
jgi:hypothetical protein